MKEMAGESAQIFFNILLIANDGKNILEDSHLASFRNRDGKTGLNHQGEKAQCFKGHRFPSGIRSAHDENPDPISHPEMNGNHLIFLLKREKRISGLFHVNASRFIQERGNPFQTNGEGCHGIEEVQFS